jgi:hypothetical protein
LKNPKRFLKHCSKEGLNFEHHTYEPFTRNEDIIKGGANKDEKDTEI